MIKNSLWTEKYRTTDINNFVASEDFKTKIKTYISKNDLPHLIFWGDVGCGKTTIVKLLAKNIAPDDYLFINASDKNGIDVIREDIKKFAQGASFSPLKLVILDEAGNLSPEAQEALNNMVEEYSAKTRFLFTCNQIEKISRPIQSRCTIYNLKAPSFDEIRSYCDDILNKENIEYLGGDVDTVIDTQYPDVRKIISTLQNLSMTGKLILSHISSNNKNILNLFKNKDWKGIRQYLIDNNIKDYKNIYKLLFNEYFDNPKIVIILADYQFKGTHTVDQEINFMSCTAKIIDELKNNLIKG